MRLFYNFKKAINKKAIKDTQAIDTSASAILFGPQGLQRADILNSLPNPPSHDPLKTKNKAIAIKQIILFFLRRTLLKSLLSHFSYLWTIEIIIIEQIRGSKTDL